MGKKSRQARQRQREFNEHLDKVAEASAISIDDQIKAAQKEAESAGTQGILVVMEDGAVEITDKVPFGRVWVVKTRAKADSLGDPVA